MVRLTGVLHGASALVGAAVQPGTAVRRWAVALDLLLIGALVLGAAFGGVSMDYDTGDAVPMLGGGLTTAHEVVAALALFARAWAPVAVLVVTVVAATGLEFTGGSADAAGIAVLVALAAVAARRPLRTSVPAYVLTLASVPLGLLGSRWRGAAVGFVDVAVVTVFAALVLFGCWAIGRNLWARRRELSELQERAARLERERVEQEERAVATERLRIARELHDVVGHHLSVMAVQTAAGRRRLPTDPDRAGEALAVAERTGRAAMRELRRVVGVLREPGEPSADGDGDLQPQPGLAQLDDLLDAARHRGLQVHLTTRGEPRDLAAGVDLTAYRIVQEALTNVSKHAGPTTVDVALTWTADALDLEVVDDGAAAPVAGAEGPGHGLLGMRERVTMLGGRLDVGPRGVRGYRVRASLPLEGHA